MIASGMTSDDISDNAVALASLADAVTLTDTEATVTRVIEQGDVKGTVTQTLDAGQEGAVTQTQTTKIAEVGDVNATALVPWRNEINHLTKRMGNLRAKILDSATESLDYGSRCMPRRAGLTQGNFGFGVRFLLDDSMWPCEKNFDRGSSALPNAKNEGDTSFGKLR